FAEQWQQRYPAIVKLWRAHWAEFIPFLAFPAEVRRVIYTTDEIVKRYSVSWAASGPRGLGRRARLSRRPASPGCVVVCRCRPRRVGRSSRAVRMRRRRVRACAACG
ncbi:MAG: transposase, partial [Actinobacteria bacterium]|nr:transposase [Actinomycetota bacterium]